MRYRRYGLCMLVLLVLTLSVAPVAYGESLQQYADTMKGLGVPTGVILADYQQDMKNTLYRELSMMYFDATKLAGKTSPEFGDPEFSSKVRQKVVDYQDSIKMYQRIVGYTDDYLYDDSMETLNEDSRDAIVEVRARLDELEEVIAKDRKKCDDKSDSCEADGRYTCWGFLPCKYDDSDYDPDIETDNVKELKDEASGKKSYTLYYVVAAIVILLLILWRTGKLGHLGAALGFTARWMAIGLTWALAFLLRQINRLLAAAAAWAAGAPGRGAPPATPATPVTPATHGGGGTGGTGGGATHPAGGGTLPGVGPAPASPPAGGGTGSGSGSGSSGGGGTS